MHKYYLAMFVIIYVKIMLNEKSRSAHGMIN